MSYRELCVLLPCHGLEDFPVHHRGMEADNLLSAWTTPWHPALIASAGKAPTWRRADDPPSPLEETLLVVPHISRDDIPSGLANRVAEGRGTLVDQQQREAMLAAALEPLGDLGDRPHPDLVADFLALGYCFLQVELLTRQMRYASNLDEFRFRETLVQAARHAVEGNDEEARKQLATCFDLLGEERDHYYSVDAFLVDLTLLAPTTLGPSLSQQLASDSPQNLLLTGEILQQLADTEPETLQSLRNALEQDRVGLIGGEQRETPVPLESLETWRESLATGLETFEKILRRRPLVFGRRQYGLSPLMPQVLHRFDFHGALHATLDDGQFPEASQVKTRWEGVDGTAMDAIARVPLDAQQPGTFLSLALRLGESMDMDHVATLCLAHWPGHVSRWYDELRRITRYTAALGRFTTIEHYFRETVLPGHLDRFTSDQYRSPYLAQRLERHETDPISSAQQYWRETIHRRHETVLQGLHRVLTEVFPSPSQPTSTAPPDKSSPPTPSPSPLKQLSQTLQTQPGKTTQSGTTTPQGGGGGENGGYLVFNPSPFARRLALQFPSSAPLAESAECIAKEWTGDQVRAVVEVPSCGFAWLEGGEASQSELAKTQKIAKRRSRRNPLLAEEGVLRNEYFEARVHPETGGLLSIRSFTGRGNLLSQQLGFRLPPQPRPHGSENQPESPTQHYTRMVSQSQKVVTASAVHGEIRTEGVLIDEEQQEEVARFVQIMRVWRGKRNLELEIQLTPHRPPRADPWNSYYASRFAWGDEEALLARSFQETRQSTKLSRVEAPHYFEIDNGHQKVAVLTGGLPFHRIVGNRALDTLLIVHGESQRTFRLGIGVELSHPYLEALDLLSTPLVQSMPAPPHGAPSGWFFQTGVKNVELTHLEPLLEEGRCVGLRFRLLETAGVHTRLKLASLHPFRAARQINGLGRSLGECTLDEGRVTLSIARHEWIELEARW
jgi:alpha-mannosidase